jgi:hypothetical protein
VLEQMGLMMRDTKLDAGTLLKEKISTHTLNYPGIIIDNCNAKLIVTKV